MDENWLATIRNHCFECLCLHWFQGDAQRICKIVESNPGIGKEIKNIFGEDRFWHPFHDGKVLIWKFNEDGLIFIGAYYSLPSELVL